MSRSRAVLLTSLAILAAPATAYADCPSSMTPPTRLNCLNTALNAAVTAIAALQAANDALVASNAALETANDELVASNAELVARVDAVEDDVANISADYLVSGDLDDYTTFDYVDSLVGAFTEGIPNLSDYLSVDTATDSIVFTGANVYVQSGSGATAGPVNGLGNLVIGYNEDADDLGFPGFTTDRTGSHNLVVGVLHSYSSFGSFVAGLGNAATGPYSSVSGGQVNEASGYVSSVSGGELNIASGWASSVSAGRGNEASGDWASVSGGLANEASGLFSSVSGGESNIPSGWAGSVSGGRANIASGDYSSVLGGNAVTVSSSDGHSP